MPDKLSFSKTFQALEHAINISHKRHNLISSNISNIDTPGYKSKDADFKGALTRALKSGHEVELATTNSKHISLKDRAAPGVQVFEDKSEWNGYNWVNVDKEMTKLTENNLIYRTSVEMLLRKIAILKEVIREGGR